MSEDESTAGRRGRGRPRSFDIEVALRRAQDAFWDTGYSATSLDDLAAATGLNRPSLYGAFGDKQTLYLAALEKSRAESVALLVEGLSPLEPLRQGLERVFSTAAALYMLGEGGQRGCFLVGTAVTESVSNPAVRAVLAGALSELDEAFERRLKMAQEAEEIAGDVDIPALAKLATAVLNGMAVRARSGGDHEALMQTGRGFIGLVCG